MSEALARELKALFARGADTPLPDGAFDALALRVFEHQHAHNAPYRAYAEAQGRTPGSVRHWTDVPLVPTTAFKALPLVCGAPAPAAVAFHTSGTTAGERRGTHVVQDVELYHASLLGAFRHWVLPDGARLPMLRLVPSAEDLPDSSLSHMGATVEEALCAAGGALLVDAAGGLDGRGWEEALARAVEAGSPVLIFATAFALAAALEHLARRDVRVRLPAGSRLMETGGFKGRRAAVSRDALRAAAEDRLGIPATHVVAEYGMTELLSQFYDPVLRTGGAVRGVFQGPPWVRTRVLDPDTLREQPAGVTGVLAHHDLANLHSVSAVLTEDLGVARADGFELLGRATGAELRGCSLTFEEIERAQVHRV